MITNITDTSNLTPIKEPVSVRLNNLHNELLANMAATAQVALTPDISAAFGQPTIQKEQSLSEALAQAVAKSESNPFRNTVFVSDYNYAKKYDDEKLGFSATRSFVDQEDMYADALQSGFFGGVKTLGKGIVSRGVSIIPKFLGGMGSVVGFAVDVLDGDVFKGKLNYTTDNFFNDWMDSFDEGLRESLPIYADKNYYQGGLMSKMMTGKFLADDFLDGVAFAVSSYGNVGALGKLAKLAKLGKLGKAAAVAGEELSIAEQAVQSSEIIREAATLSAREVVQTFVKNWKTPVTNFIKNDAVKSTFKSWAKSGGYAAFNTVSEAGLEARDFKKQYKQELIEKGYSEEEANEIASEKAFDVFSGNMVALMASNIIEVRTMFPQLFNTVEGDIKAMKKAIVNGTPVAEVSLAKQMLKTVGTNIAAEGLWEENIQTSIQQYQQNSSPTDSSFMDVMTGSITKMLSGIGYFGKSLVGGYSELTQEQKEQVDSIVLGAMVGGGMSVIGSIKEHKALKAEQEAFNKNYNEYKTAQAQLFNILGSDLKNVYKSQTITNPDGSTKTVYSDEQGNVLYDEDKIAKLAFLNVENQKLINEYFYRITNNDKKGAEFLLDQAYARLAFQSFSNSIWDGDTDLALTDLKNKVKSLNLEDSEINTLMSLANDKTEYLSELAEIFKSVQQEQLNKRIDNQADAYFNRFALAAMFYEKTKQRTFTNFLSEYQTELQELTNNYAQPKEILNEKGERVENPEYKEKTQEDLRKESYLKNQIAQLESQINESESNINMFRDDKRRKSFYKDVINNDAEQADLNKMYKEALESESEIKKEIEQLYKSLQSLDINALDYESKKEDLQNQIKDKEAEHEKLKDNTYKALEEADAKTRVEGDIKFSSNYNYKTGEYRSFDEQLKKGVNEYGLKNKPYLDSFADMKLSLEFHNVLNKLLNTDLQYSDFSDISSLNFSTNEYLKTWQIIKDFLANKKDISQEDLDLIEQFYFKLRQELNSSKDSVTYLKSITKSPFEPSEQVLNHPAFALIENLVNESIDTLNDTISEYEDIEEYEDMVDVLQILISEKTQYNTLVSDAKEVLSNIEDLEKAAKELKKMDLSNPISREVNLKNNIKNKALSIKPIGYYKQSKLSEDFDSPSINLINAVNAQFFFDRGYIVSFLQLAKSKIESYEALADKNQYAESLNALYKIKNTLTAWKNLIKEGDRAKSDWFNGLSSDIENNLKELDVLIEQAKKAASNRLVNQKLNYIQNKIAQFISVGFDINNEALSINENHFLAKYLKQPEFKDFLGKKIDELTEFDFEKITSILRTIIPAAELNSISKKIDTDITNVSKNIKLPSNINDTFGATVLDLSSLDHPIFRTFSQTSNLYALLNDLKGSDIQSLTGIMLGTKTKDELTSIVETLIDIQLLNSVKLNLNTSFNYKNYLTELKKYEDSQQIGLSDEQKLAHLNFAKFLNSNIPLPIFMLNAVAGSGKTSTFKWLFSVSDMTAENTAFFTTTDTATETLKNSLGVNTVTTITNESFSKIESNVEYIVIDEVSLMTARQMDQLDKLKTDKSNLKIILLGDNSQLSQNNNSIVINSDSQIAYNTPLTLAFRAKVNAISDAYNAFKNNSNNVSEVTVSASGPIGESSFGVHAVNPNDSSFEKQIELEIANNSDIAIITSSDKIDDYKKKYPTVTVVTPTDSQSITKQKVFIDFSYEDYTANRLGIRSFTGSDFFVKTFNKLMYTALSRASEYVMIKDYQNIFSNTQDPTLQETVSNNIEQSNQDIKNNKQQFKEWIQSELDKFENKPKEPETKPKPEDKPEPEPDEPGGGGIIDPPVNQFEEYINKDTELKELIAKYPELYAILEWVFNTKGNETMNAEMYKNMVSLVYNKLTDTESSTVQSYIKQQSEC